MNAAMHSGDDGMSPEGEPADCAGPVPAQAAVSHLDAHRIARALASRSRYRYVRPRVLPEGRGWKIVSPNCSRSIQSDGGEIDIAWIVPDRAGGWLLFAWDDAAGDWRLSHQGDSLPALLALLCTDPNREFWR